MFFISEVLYYYYYFSIQKPKNFDRNIIFLGYMFSGCFSNILDWLFVYHKDFYQLLYYYMVWKNPFRWWNISSISFINYYVLWKKIWKSTSNHKHWTATAISKLSVLFIISTTTTNVIIRKPSRRTNFTISSTIWRIAKPFATTSVFGWYSIKIVLQT